MTNVACQLQHAVEAEVTCSFAWNWRTNVANWDDPLPNFNSTAHSLEVRGESLRCRDRNRSS